jgi:hypothetical protein
VSSAFPRAENRKIGEFYNSFTPCKEINVSIGCPGHKYEYIRTEIFVMPNGKKDGRFFTEHGKCIHCGKLFSWCNYVDKNGIKITHDRETGKSYITVLGDCHE